MRRGKDEGCSLPRWADQSKGTGIGFGLGYHGIKTHCPLIRLHLRPGLARFLINHIYSLGLYRLLLSRAGGQSWRISFWRKTTNPCASFLRQRWSRPAIWSPILATAG